MRNTSTDTTRATATISDARAALRTLMIPVVTLLGLLAPSAADAAAAASPVAPATAVSGASWAPHLARRIVSTKATAHGMQRATWYGPGLYGNRTGCGSRLTRETWGIAHRTLPCGTLVTLANAGRRISVRVVDRGPYSGATVDLTERTSRFLGFVSGSVRMTEVRRFRVLAPSMR